MLDQDVCTLLAACPARVGQWSQAPGIPTPHVHPILQKKAHFHSWHDVAGNMGSWGEKGGGFQRVEVKRMSGQVRGPHKGGARKQEGAQDSPR